MTITDFIDFIVAEGFQCIAQNRWTNGDVRVAVVDSTTIALSIEKPTRAFMYIPMKFVTAKMLEECLAELVERCGYATYNIWYTFEGVDYWDHGVRDYSKWCDENRGATITRVVRR